MRIKYGSNIEQFQKFLLNKSLYGSVTVFFRSVQNKGYYLDSPLIIMNSLV